MRQHPWELSTDRLIQVDSFFFFAPCKGIRKFIACGILNPGGDFAYGIWNPEFWNQEYRSRLESRIQVLLTNTGIQYLSGIRNPQRGMQNPRLSRIPNPGGDFPYGIRNPDFWNPQYSSRNPESTGIQYLESGIRSVECRIQDCPGFFYMGRDKPKS